MDVLRRRLNPLTWLALVALLGLALLPTLSHALAFAQGESRAWAEVCTPQGVRVVALEAGADTPPVPAAVHLEHCPFCSLGNDAPPLPPAAATARTDAPQGPTGPAVGQHAPATHPVWSDAQPRAPPVRS